MGEPVELGMAYKQGPEGRNAWHPRFWVIDPYNILQYWKSEDAYRKSYAKAVKKGAKPKGKIDLSHILHVAYIPEGTSALGGMLNYLIVTEDRIYRLSTTADFRTKFDKEIIKRPSILSHTGLVWAWKNKSNYGFLDRYWTIDDGTTWDSKKRSWAR